MKNERNKLVFSPDWSKANPYQKLLYASISKAGIPCKGLEGKNFTFSWLLRNRKSVKFIHLHWLFGIYNPKNTPNHYKKILAFYLKIVVARMLGYRILWTVHNLISHECRNPRFETWIRKKVANAADAVIVHCNYAKALIQDKCEVAGDKVRVIPHGSYTGFYPNKVSRKEAREKLLIEDGAFAFLYFGMIRGYKGLGPLVKSFKEVKKTHPDVRLIIAGKPFNKAIEKETEKIIAGDKNILPFLRFIPDEEIQCFFNAADIVVLPYSKVLTSGAALLSFTFGRGVIAPGIGCLPELVDDGCGLLYDRERGLTGTMLEAARRPDIECLNRGALEAAEGLRWERLIKDEYLPLLTKGE